MEPARKTQQTGESLMSKAAVLCLAALISVPAFAQNDLNMQAGLWEFKPIKAVTDGVDNSAQMSEQSARMQAAMASMTPDQRAKMEAMMQQHGVNMNASGGGVSFQICRTAEQAQKHWIPVNQNGHCQSSYTQSGSSLTFSYSCPFNGGTESGKGTATRSGDTISIVSDGTSTGPDGTHARHGEIQMRYLGADCGAVKPMSEGK
jgi:hypothetical protein